MIIRIIKWSKDCLLFIPITLVFYPIHKLMVFVVHFNYLILWIYRHKKNLLLCDFYNYKRDYKKRFALYDFIIQYQNLQSTNIIYLEFGVAAGASLKYWMDKNQHQESLFYGFDTFEGLPEKWGHFKKGDMNSSELTIKEEGRVSFVKGLFQDTLHDFIINNSNILKNQNLSKVIHLDADLYSSTLFVLSQIHPYFKKGDIVIFDEFSVALHEFKAFKEYMSSFYGRLKPIASVNNFLQVAFIVE